MKTQSTRLQPIRIVDRFFADANKLRKSFEARYQDPYSTSSHRFIWDVWNVKNQYRLLRTPAESFFSKSLTQSFLNHLLNWGRKNLGCQMISHPWLSVYLDGDFQNLHSDVPHGPYSFVYSLTKWKQRKFSGGETLIAKPALLNYFSHYNHDSSFEGAQFFNRIAPEFNRLTVFDPRYPHGVERVEGVKKIQAGRAVIHGWFTEPRPMVEGTLSVRSCLKPMDQLAQQWMDALSPHEMHGLLSVRITISPSGRIEKREVLCGHLINDSGSVIPARVLDKHLVDSEVSFPKSSGKTIITLPLEFRKSLHQK